MAESPPHRAQLLICHEKIAAPPPQPVREPTGTQFCSLAAAAWCFDCGFYVCSIHHVANHISHDAVVEYPAHYNGDGLPPRTTPRRSTDAEFGLAAQQPPVEGSWWRRRRKGKRKDDNHQ